MADLQLRQTVLDELEFEPSLDAAHVGVAVANGVVTLTGTVASYVEKVAAAAAARRVKDVRAVADEIEVRRAADKKFNDDQIAKRALDILDWDALVPPGAVQVTVRRGWVTLTGNVDWYYQKKAAEEDIRKLSGVCGVFNRIEIAPSLQPADVQKKIEDALKRHAEVEAGAIRVSVHNGADIVLEGTVDSWKERLAAEQAAWSAPGVKSVDDKITIR